VPIPETHITEPNNSGNYGPKDNEDDTVVKTSEIPDLQLNYEHRAVYIGASGGYIRINNNISTKQSVGLLSQKTRFKHGAVCQFVFTA